MKQLPRATAEKTKPICKNEKMNLNPCSEMTYEEKCPSDDPKNKPNQTQFKENVIPRNRPPSARRDWG
jgi:hypothetical protein